jgi:hypothetical protein
LMVVNHFCQSCFFDFIVVFGMILTQFIFYISFNYRSTMPTIFSTGTFI